MAKQSLPLSRVYRLIEPGPVVMLTTAHKGCANIMAMSWHMMVEFQPPMPACVISARNYTFGLLKETKECAINIPTVELTEKVVKCGNTSGREVDKFKILGLTPSPASHIRAPLIDECYASLECRVVDTMMVAKYNIFILEMFKAWIDRSIREPRTIHHLGKGAFMVAGETVKCPPK